MLQKCEDVSHDLQLVCLSYSIGIRGTAKLHLSHCVPSWDAHHGQPSAGESHSSHYFQEQVPSPLMSPLMSLHHGTNLGSRGADGLQNKPGLSDFARRLCFLVGRPGQSEGRRHANLGVKLPPVGQHVGACCLVRACACVLDLFCYVQLVCNI